MRRVIELKHVGPKAHVRQLLEELMDRLEERLSHFPGEATSVHVVFEENGSHKLYRASFTCHIPRHMVAAHEEDREAGVAIREAFKELERQLEKRKAFMRREPARRHARHAQLQLWWVATFTLVCAPLYAEDPTVTIPSAKAVEALRLLESKDDYQRQLGFLRLEALREPSTIEPISQYLKSRDAELRALTLRALAAIQGPQAIPTLLEKLKTEKHARVRLAALLGLEPLQAHDAAILPAFLKALRDRDTEVRMAAVDVVSRIDDPRAREAIHARHRRERRKDVRRVLTMAMKRLEANDDTTP